MEWIEIFIKSLSAGVAAIGFAILFNVPQRTLFAVGITGTLGGLIKFGFMHAGAGIVFASFLSSTLIGMVSIRMAHFKHSPPLVFYIPSVIPLIPGFFIYKMFLGFMSLTSITDQNQYLQTLMETLNNGIKSSLIMIALGIGVAFPMLILRKETVKKKKVASGGEQ